MKNEIIFISKTLTEVVVNDQTSSVATEVLAGLYLKLFGYLMTLFKVFNTLQGSA